jgi:hypothetical protein
MSLSLMTKERAVRRVTIVINLFVQSSRSALPQDQPWDVPVTKALLEPFSTGATSSEQL